MQRLLMRLEVVGGETLSKLNRLFREKVQLEEQVKDNEINLHFSRGVMQGMEVVKEEISKIMDEDKLAGAKQERLEKQMAAVAAASAVKASNG
jgi:hypothetical protein